MAHYRITYLNRDGHPTHTTIHAPNKRIANQVAHEKYDDVWRVKRIHGPWATIFFSLLAITILVFLLVKV